jgi:hypothetical protein
MILIAIAAGSYTMPAAAQARDPKWHARESAGKHEHELSGELHLRPVDETLSIKFYLAKGEGVDEETELAVGCHDSSIEGATIAGGTPGTVKFKKITISGCEEALTEPCTVKSSTETVTLENVDGELVYSGRGSIIRVLIKPVKFSIGVVCKDGRCPNMGTENVDGGILADISADFVYSEFVEFSFSPLDEEYEEDSSGADAETALGGTGPIEANRGGFEFSLVDKLEAPPTEDKEVEAE